MGLWSCHGSSPEQLQQRLTRKAPQSRAQVDVQLRAHDADGLPAGHPEIREQVQPLEDYYQQRLNNRVADYGLALRMASLKVRGNVPSLAEIRELNKATDKPAKYRELIRRFLDAKVKDAQGTLVADTRVHRTVRAFWMNTFKMGTPVNPALGSVSQDSVANLATEVALSDVRPFTDLFTSDSGQCTSMNSGTGEFTTSTCMCSDGNVASGASVSCYATGEAPAAGIVGNPGFMAMHYSGMAFRRVRMVQELFACRPMPAESQDVWDAYYPPAEGTSSMADTPVNFAATDGVVCSKCHQTMNRQAPLFANYDMMGVFRGPGRKLTASGRTCSTSSPFSCSFEVNTPSSPEQPSILAHYLTSAYTSGSTGPQLGWRVSATVPDLTSFGSAMADDPEVARCMVDRLWYWLMSRGEISIDAIRPPYELTEAWVEVLVGSSHPDYGAYNSKTLKPVMFTMLTSDDFVRF
jgi:hypothetical protein